MSERKPIRYRDAGVDIDAAASALSSAKAMIEATQGPECLGGIGGFGGLYRMPMDRYREPVLVASTDSVGTKVKVAVLADRHDTVGIDIVNHCVNDILVQGARPLFFLDYIGIGRVTAEVMAGLLTGLSRACEANGCALLGGETAEMPDVYAEGEYDLVGTITGVVERDKILTGAPTRPGDRLIGLPSNGLHTNGYTLARRILFDREGLSPDTFVPELGESVADALLRPHTSYLAPVSPLLDRDLLRGMAHITGGGLTDNLPRVLPEGTAARIDTSTFEVPPIFRFLAERGPVPRDECHRAFNMGVGMILIVAPEKLDDALACLAESGQAATVIGEITAGNRTVSLF